MQLQKLSLVGLMVVGMTLSGCSFRSTPKPVDSQYGSVVTTHAETVKLINGKNMVMQLPDRWTVTSAQRQGQTIKVKLQNESYQDNAAVLLSINFTDGLSNQPSSLPAVRQSVERKAAAIQPQALEAPIVVEAFARHPGYYFKATDKNLRVEDTANIQGSIYLLQGTFIFEGGTASFTGVTNYIARDKNNIVSMIETIDIQ